MLFLNILSLLYLTHLANSRSLSESEAMNKIIEDILSKAEKKNAEPIKFCWTDRIVADSELTTPHYLRTRIPVNKNNNIFDVHVEPFLRDKPKLKVPPLSLQDIISQINRIQAQTDRHSLRFNDYRTKKDDSLHSAVTRKANHSSRTRTHYKYRTTRTVARLQIPIGFKKLTSRSSTTQKSLAGLRPMHNEQFIGKVPVGVTKHITNFQENAVRTTSREVKETVSQAVKQTAVPKHDYLQPEGMEATKEFSKFDMRPITNSLYSMNRYNNPIKSNYDEIELKINNAEHYTPSRSFITARHWGTLDSMDHLLNSVPNYDKTESLENIMKNIAREISSIDVKDTTASHYKPDLKSLDELDVEMRNKPVVNTRTVLALKSVGTKYYDATSEMTPKRSTNLNHHDASLRLVLGHSTSSYRNVSSIKTTLKRTTSTDTSLPYSNMINLTSKHSTNTFSTLPTVEADNKLKYKESSYSTSTDLTFLSTMLKDMASTNSNLSSLEFTEHSTPLKSINSKNTNDNFTSSDMYLLVNQKDNLLKGYFSINNSNADKAQHVEVISPSGNYNPPVIHKLTEDIDSTSSLGYVTYKPDVTSKNTETADLYKEIMQLFDNIKPANQENKDKPVLKKKSNVINWERIKKFFGHDRVCNCRCRENKTICRVCAASDAVIRELTFEFNNLAEYMQRHCTEIQTFFWMNPSGGKKLRDAVHKIDKSMQDYYKRVKGKCSGRTCKTFATYLDKRQSERKKKMELKYLENLLEELSHRSDNYYNKIST